MSGYASKPSPATEAIRTEDWDEFIRRHHARPLPPDRTAVILGVLCGVGASLLISAWVLLLQEVAATHPGHAAQTREQ